MLQARPASIRGYNRKASELGNRFRILQRVVQPLTASQRTAFDQAPAIVIMREADRRTVFCALGVESGTHFVHGGPSALKINVGKIPVFADSTQPQQFSLCDRDTDVLRRGGGGGNPVAQGVHAEGRDDY